ncbi:hypothetical protein AB1L30_01225 [Bremerella sp. JC817]|uniref:hypothetical protein n=1 Tax=Bremerella sp. JC817 TaxID=3231756 RepID=UPI00345A8358
MSNGIVKLENNKAIAWAPIHDGNRCVTFFDDNPIIGPLPEGYEYSDSLEASLTVAQLKEREVLAWYADQIAAGWFVQLRDDFGVVVYEPGYTLRIDDAARNEFDQLATTWTLNIIMGADPALFTTKIYGMDPATASGNDGGHLVTIDVFLAIVQAGGIYYQALLDLKEDYIQAIEAGNVAFTVGDPLPVPE